MEQKYEGYYVTSCGRVWSYKHKRFLKPHKTTKRNYLQVRIWDYNKGKGVTKNIHRMVAECWIPNPENLPQVNHKDENQQNNAVPNLEWCSNLYNQRYGTVNSRRAEKCYKKVRCIETGEVFESCKATGVNPCSLSGHLHGRYKSAYGYHWEWVNE